MGDFERNATAAERALVRELPWLIWQGGPGWRAVRAWQREIAARQPASGFTSKPPENKSKSSGNANFTAMLADMIEEALKARALGVGNDAIFGRLRERYEAARQPAPPPEPPARPMTLDEIASSVLDAFPEGEDRRRVWASMYVFRPYEPKDLPARSVSHWGMFHDAP